MSKDLPAVPTHVGLILDGNRRWAKAQGLAGVEGHRKGYEILKDIGQHLFNQGVSYVSAYIFSTENWKRTKEEVDYLMDLVLWVAREELAELNERNIRIRFLGIKDGIRDDIVKALTDAEERTAKNDGGTMGLCFNYGGQAEIVAAVRAALENGIKPADLNEKTIAAHLWAPDMPDIDLVIRTAGEQRLSNFMLWRVAYAELYFTDTYWPDMTNADIDQALEWYAARERRFGGNAKP